MERLILEEKVDFCVGAISSAVTLAMMQVANKYNKILMVPISQSVKITGESKNKQTFRTCANPAITSKGLCKWMLGNLGKKVYLLTVDYEWGRSTSQEYHKALTEMGGTIVGETFFPLNNKDFAPYFGKIKATKPDAVLNTGYYPDIVLFMRQAREMGFQTKAIIGHGAGYANFPNLEKQIPPEVVQYLYNIDGPPAQNLDRGRLLLALAQRASHTITVCFSRVLNEATATNPANYSVAVPNSANTLSLLQARLLNGTNVIPTTGPQLSRADYVVTISNVTEAAQIAAPAF
jgi:hypothetical protein